MDDDLSLGTCCGCGTDKDVHNIVAYALEAPEPGHGWGCVVCNLPSDGAIGVFCDECIEGDNTENLVCVGPASDNRRVPLESLTVPFNHHEDLHMADGDFVDVSVSSVVETERVVAIDKGEAISDDEISSIEIDMSGLRWFNESPDAGHEDCTCSDCNKIIEVEPLRLFRGDQEARLCDDCMEKRAGFRFQRFFEDAWDYEEMD